MSYQRWVADKLASEPQEGFLKVIVRLGRNVVVLQIFLPVKGDGLGLDFPLLDIDLIATKDDGDVLADTDEVACRRH